jgi:Trypsin-like peptidase domain
LSPNKKSKSRRYRVQTIRAGTIVNPYMTQTMNLKLTLVLALVLMITAVNLAGGLIPPVFLDCVVAIGYRPLTAVRGSDGKLVAHFGAFMPIASGFLYGRFVKKINEKEKEYLPYLVTNQHVLEDIERIEKQQIEEISKIAETAKEVLLIPPAGVFLRFNPKAVGAASQDFFVPLHSPDLSESWTQDKDSDLAVIAIAVEVLKKAGIQYDYFHSDEVVADRSKADEIGITEGDGVYVLGFPMGLVGGERNFVIARQGAIARVRDCLAGTTNRFLIDALVFPGNSGGPVISRAELTSLEGTKAQSRCYLIGVVRGYVPYREVAVSQQTGQARIVFEENSGLAEVIPMDLVQKLIDQHQELLLKRK